MTKEITQKEGYSFEAWKGMRKSFIDNIQTILVSGKDYHDLNFRGKEVRVLAKGVAEKVASAFNWVASFTKDTETIEMIDPSSPLGKGLIAYVCKLSDKKGNVIGEGRGARNVNQDKDANKAIKMAQKSAFIDAVLRASGLSDLFTQDLEDVKDEPVKGAEIVERVIEVEETIAPPPTVNDEKKTIVTHLKRLGMKDTRKKEEVEKEILKLTGLTLSPENYAEIIGRLNTY